jgi:hypothetical protein
VLVIGYDDGLGAWLVKNSWAAVHELEVEVSG